MQRFQALGHALDQAVGGIDDMPGAAVVEGQIGESFHAVILLEAADVAVAGLAEGVDVLVVVAHRQNRQFVVFAGRAASQRRYQAVVLFADVLVFVHQNIAKAGHDAVTRIIVFAVGTRAAFQQLGSLKTPLLETIAVFFLRVFRFFVVKTHA